MCVNNPSRQLAKFDPTVHSTLYSGLDPVCVCVWMGGCVSECVTHPTHSALCNRLNKARQCM